jgi:hypothetical protein
LNTLHTTFDYNSQWLSRHFAITVYITLSLCRNYSLHCTILSPLGLLSLTSPRVPASNGGRYPSWVPQPQLLVLTVLSLLHLVAPLVTGSQQLPLSNNQLFWTCVQYPLSGAPELWSSGAVLLQLEFFLLPTVSRPVSLGIGPPFGTLDQILFCSSFVGQLRCSAFNASSLTRGRVCNLLLNCCWALPEQSHLSRSPAELTAIFYCLI